MAAGSAAGTLIEVLVAPGRTIVDETGAHVPAGQPAKIAKADLKRLQALGFIADEPPAEGEVRPGPRVTVTEGPTVRRAP